MDMSAWQQENEFTRRKDHNKLVEISNQLRQSNAAVVEELSRHGETLEELSRTVNVSLGSILYHGICLLIAALASCIEPRR